MHIPDGLFIPINPVTHTINIPDTLVLVGTWAVTIPFLFLAWKKTKNEYSNSFAGTLAVLSALIFVVQMLTFPVPGGTTVHILGGTLVAVILGPYAGMLSLTMVLGMQAVFFADGGLLAFGANALNMAVIGSLSFFIVKALSGKVHSSRRFALSVFLATFISAVLTAVLTGAEVGVSQAFVNSGGLALTVPTMFSVYAIEGLIEAIVTSLTATALMTSLPHFHAPALVGLRILSGKDKP